MILIFLHRQFINIHYNEENYIFTIIDDDYYVV